MTLKFKGRRFFFLKSGIVIHIQLHPGPREWWRGKRANLQSSLPLGLTAVRDR